MMSSNLYERVVSGERDHMRLFVEAKGLHEASPYGSYAGEDFQDLDQSRMTAAMNCSYLRRAETLYRRSIEEERSGKRIFNEGIARYQLGLLLQWQGRAQEACEQYEQAADIFADSINREALGAFSDTLFRHAEIHCQLREYEAALTMLERCLEIDQERGSQEGAALARHLIDRISGRRPIREE